MYRQYFCIDLKSFYASVECVERGLDPMTTPLVVADPSRTEKTICLAVSPALKALGVKGRPRLFEIPTSLDFIIAPPRMQKYIDYSAEIYEVYLSFFSSNDIHVYSIDEVFIDVTSYLTLYGKDSEALAAKVMDAIFIKTGIRSACGIGTNLYLSKIALDITAKHSPDFIGILDEESFKTQLWDHTPLTDFWRIGKGTADRLQKRGITTMRHIAEANEDLLYNLFGIDAELLIDHAHGLEPTTISDIKAYMPKSTCITSGQVLMRNYSFDEALIIVKEMTDELCLELCLKKAVVSSMTLQIGYGDSTEHVHGSISTDFTSSPAVLIPLMEALYKKCVSRSFQIRRINITFNNVLPDCTAQQLTFFTDDAEREKQYRLQTAIRDIKFRFDKNSILRCASYQDCATARDRNCQIGGHKSG